jgi:superfamily II DNA helicase RecQ
MQFQFFWIPVGDPATATATLNRTLAEQRVIQVDSEFVQNGQMVGWAICVQTTVAAARKGETAQSRDGQTQPASTAKIDYRDVLSADDFTVFAELRVWRKKRAAEEGVPIYALATNEQLACVARERPESKAALEKIKGLGSGRIAKYAEDLLGICCSAGRVAAVQR